MSRSDIRWSDEYRRALSALVSLPWSDFFERLATEYIRHLKLLHGLEGQARTPGLTPGATPC